MIAIGFAVQFFGKKERFKHHGKGILGLGLSVLMLRLVNRLLDNGDQFGLDGYIRIGVFIDR